MTKSYDRNSYKSSRSSARGDSKRATRSSSRRSSGAHSDVSDFSGSSSSYRRNRDSSMGASAFSRPKTTSFSRRSHEPVTDSRNPYSRGSSNYSYKAQKKKRRGKKILIGALAAVLVLILAGGGAAFAYVMSIQGKMQEGVDPALLSILDTSAPGDPFYMVLMGTDKSEERDQSGEYGAYRSDSIMLLRVDPKEKIVSAVSLMRDTLVDIPGYGEDKLNAAYTYGGAPLVVQTVSDYAGVPISHYAEVNFDGFQDIVDALGGITVNVPIDINDELAGGSLSAGEQTLNGEQALILCRSRHAFDEYGKGDEFRAANQRMVIGAIAQKVLDSDVPTMISTISALADYVTTDYRVTEIISLANSMRGMSMDTDFYTAVNPTISRMINDIWYEVTDEYAWKNMMDRVDQGLPPTEETVVDERTGVVMSGAGGAENIAREGTVAIRNGSTIEGAAVQAQECVQALGYSTDAKNADSQTYKNTLVVYHDDSEKRYAQEIVEALGVGTAIRNDDKYLFEADYLVVIGADWQ